MTEALEPVSKTYVVLQGDAKKLREGLVNMLGQGVSEFTLDTLRVPAGAGKSWTIPSLEGEKEAKEVTGVIVAMREPRVYWAKGLDESGGSMPPDCSSPDGKYGVGDPGGECKPCEKNQWGSAMKNGQPQRGKACKETRVIFMIRSTDRIPIRIVAPPGSLSEMQKYFLRLINEGVTNPWEIATTLALKQVRSKGGILYSQISPSLAQRLSPEEQAGMRAYAEAISPIFERASSVAATDLQPED